MSERKGMSLEGAMEGEVKENDIKELDKEIMRRKLEGLPDGMGNPRDRAENFPQEVKDLQQKFNQKQWELKNIFCQSWCSIKMKVIFINVIKYIKFLVFLPCKIKSPDIILFKFFV